MSAVNVGGDTFLTEQDWLQGLGLSGTFHSFPTDMQWHLGVGVMLIIEEPLCAR